MGIIKGRKLMFKKSQRAMGVQESDISSLEGNASMGLRGFGST